MSKVATPALSIRELLEQVYNQLRQELPGREIDLADRVFVEIANDSDEHRTRKGYMMYDKLVIAEINGKKWLLGNGEASSDYQADPFDSDILTISLDIYMFDEAKINELIAQYTYFKSSALFGLSDGQFDASSKSPVAILTLEAVRDQVEQFIASPVEYRTDVVALDGRNIPLVNASYKPGFVPVLAEAIKNALVTLSA